ncbi:MAG TPA: group II intron reverse transcriptase/maturase [Verrucomicrobiota bacterium]|nr:group II intron reverse transcriptase/maturase [Verrucomicrobiota bacterium]
MGRAPRFRGEPDRGRRAKPPSISLSGPAQNAARQPDIFRFPAGPSPHFACACEGDDQRTTSTPCVESRLPRRCSPAAPARASLPRRASLLENVACWDNLWRACERVRKNGGAPGLDGMTVEELPGHFDRNANAIQRRLRDGTYRPEPLRKVTVEKPDHSGERTLAIPTVLDRVVQHAVQQVITPLFDPHFSPSSFAFRPRRNAHQALLQAQRFVAKGLSWVVHVDLKAFFGSIEHDRLLQCLAARMRDPRLLDLIQRFVAAPFLHNGVTEDRPIGIPEGAPLSPLLANVFLDGFDKAIESQGYPFCRYADDINLFVASEAAAQTLLDKLQLHLPRTLRVEINERKSGIGRPWTLPFLGYLIIQETGALKAAPASWRQLKDKLREILARNRHADLDTLLRDHINPVLRGWREYFRLGITPEADRDFQAWLLDHLRRRLWHDWDQPKRRARHLMQRGIPANLAWEAAETGYHNSAAPTSLAMEDAFPPEYFMEKGLLTRGGSGDEHQNQGPSVAPPVIYGRFFD